MSSPYDGVPTDMNEFMEKLRTNRSYVQNLEEENTMLYYQIEQLKKQVRPSWWARLFNRRTV